MKITTSLIKKLRDLTGAGMMDCKRALIEANSNIELAIKNLRKSGTIKAVKKSVNSTTEGLIKIKIDGNFGVILEINCQTDFAARNSDFQSFSDKIINIALAKKITDINILKIYFEKELINLITKIGENINIRRIATLEDELISSYLHHSIRIGVLVSAKGTNDKIIKQIAMHIAARKPEFISPENIPNEIIKKEHQIQLDIVTKCGKQKEIIEKIVEGRIKKFINEISLINQDFIFDTNKTVGQFLEENNTKITSFIRFEVGENIDKIETNFNDKSIKYI